MENHLYICQYCAKDYKPKRRKIQKYCSNSCRTRAFNSKNELGQSKPENLPEIKEVSKIGKMSMAGVGNAAVGTLAINALTSLLTKEENKPATKRDIKEIKDLLLDRFHEVNNMQLDLVGSKPFYDLETKTIVYLKNRINGN